MGIAVRKGDSLKAEFDAALAKIKESGKLAEIEKAHFQSDTFKFGTPTFGVSIIHSCILSILSILRGDHDNRVKIYHSRILCFFTCCL